MKPSEAACFDHTCCESDSLSRLHLSKLQKLLNSSIDVICSFDEDGRFLYVNEASRSVWGYEPNELIGTRYMDLVRPSDHPKTIAAAEAIMSGVNLTFFENNYIKSNGSFIPVIWSATWDKHERIMYCVAKDASEKKRLEQSLAYAQDLLHSFMSNSPIVGWITDESGIMHYMNPLYQQTYGFSEADFGKSIYELFPGQVAVDYHFNDLCVIRDGKAIETIQKALLPDGTEQVLKIFKFPIATAHGKMVAGWAADITEQVDLQNELLASVEQYHYVNEATSDAIYDWDIKTNKIYRGVGFQSLFGFSEKEVTLTHRMCRIHPNDLENYKKVIFRCLRTSSNKWCFEYRFKDANGNYRHVVDKAFIIYKEGKAVRVIGALQDITEQKSLHHRLMVQEKRASREVMKSIIEAQEKERRKLSVELHDNVNQMLASCKLMLEYAKDNQESAQALTEKSYAGLQQVINEIRKISHDLNPSVIEDVGLVDAIEQLIDPINASKKLNVQFDRKIGKESVFGPEAKVAVFRIIQEQLSNIIKHARASDVLIGLSAENNDVEITIQDNGIGFDMKKVKKGLGLKNICHRIEYYNGKITFDSEPGKGCKVSASLKIG